MSIGKLCISKFKIMPSRVAVAAAVTVSAAQHMKSKIVVNNTRRCYEGKLNVIKIHLLSNPSTLDQVEVIEVIEYMLFQILLIVRPVNFLDKPVSRKLCYM